MDNDSYYPKLPSVSCCPTRPLSVVLSTVDPSSSEKTPLQWPSKHILLLVLLLPLISHSQFMWCPFLNLQLSIFITLGTEISISSTSLILNVFLSFKSTFPASCKCLSNTFKLNTTKTKSTIFPAMIVVALL